VKTVLEGEVDLYVGEGQNFPAEDRPSSAGMDAPVFADRHQAERLSIRIWTDD
jgi:hypothetical protein